MLTKIGGAGRVEVVDWMSRVENRLRRVQRPAIQMLRGTPNSSTQFFARGLSTKYALATAANEYLVSCRPVDILVVRHQLYALEKLFPKRTTALSRLVSAASRNPSLRVCSLSLCHNGSVGISSWMDSDWEKYRKEVNSETRRPIAGRQGLRGRKGTSTFRSSRLTGAPVWCLERRTGTGDFFWKVRQ